MNSPEGVVGWNTAPGRPQLKAVAALLRDRNTSAIVTLKSSGINSMKDLDGKRYASYAARFEGRIVQRMIQHAGGVGDYVEDTPPMLGIWNTLLEGEADATWVFTQWEGVEAKLKGVELNAFPVCDFGVPYAYSFNLGKFNEAAKRTSMRSKNQNVLDAEERHERQADCARPVRRAARKHPNRLAAQAWRPHLRLDGLAAIFVEEEDEPHVRELLEAVEAVAGVYAAER